MDYFEVVCGRCRTRIEMQVPATVPFDPTRTIPCPACGGGNRIDKPDIPTTPYPQHNLTPTPARQDIIRYFDCNHNGHADHSEDGSPFGQ